MRREERAFAPLQALITSPSATVANSRETNKQPQLQKQAQNKPSIFFDYLLSSILFIINYLLPINEPHIYSLKYMSGVRALRLSLSPPEVTISRTPFPKLHTPGTCYTLSCFPFVMDYLSTALPLFCLV